MRSEDWIKYTLDQPMNHEPGEKWVYNGGCLMMLSDILKNSSDYLRYPFLTVQFIGGVNKCPEGLFTVIIAYIRNTRIRGRLSKLGAQR